MYFFILQQSFRGRGHDTYALIRYSGTQNRLTVSWQLCDKPLINPLDQCQYPCTPILPSPDPTLSCYQLTVFELGERWVCSFSDNDIDPTNLILKGQTLILLRGVGGGGAPTLCFLVGHLYSGHILELVFTELFQSMTVNFLRGPQHDWQQHEAQFTWWMCNSTVVMLSNGNN